MLPIVGGPLAVVVNRAFGSAVQRRHERDIAEIRSDLDAVIARYELSDATARVSTDEFVAAMHAIAPAIQSTASEGKRKLLRNALINGAFLGDWPDYKRESFMRQMAAYDAFHVVVLQYVSTLPPFDPEEMPESGVWRDLDAMIVDELFPSEPEMRPIVQRAIKQLDLDGLLVQAQPQTRGVQNTGNAIRPDAISDLGRDFLEFVSDPLDD